MVSSVLFKMKPRVYLFSLQILLHFQTHGNDGRIRKNNSRCSSSRQRRLQPHSTTGGRKEALPLVNELIWLTPVDTPGKVDGEE